MADYKQTVLVLDLDDTLYQEADYQVSGLREICASIESLYGKTIVDSLMCCKDQGESDLLAAACRLANLPLAVKESMLWIYRNHVPSIFLDDTVKALLIDFQQMFHAVVVLTDGRSIGQRQKLKALGLGHLPVYISEEYHSEKPALLRFQLIMRDFPVTRFVYVGDNPQKDFVAPNMLGWTTVGLRGNARNIHSQSCQALPVEYLPQKWIENWTQLICAIA
jgi:putative hydrolase of the HAD superfamily